MRSKNARARAPSALRPPARVVSLTRAPRAQVLAALEPGTAAVVVSHLFVTRTVVQEALRARGDATPIGDIDIPTASVSCIEYAADGPAGGAVVFSGRKPEALAASTNDLTGAS